MDQTTFFSSSDIQYLRIGTILKGGLLLPPSLDPATTVEHSYNLMSVSCSPQRGLEVARNFLSLFSAQGQGGLVFEVKFRAQQFWQMRIRFLINAERAEKLEEFISRHNLAVKKKFHVEKITVPENNSEVWRRICHGVQQKRSFNIVSSHETDMMDIPCPFTGHSCYATQIYVPVWSKSVNKYNLIKTRIIILGRSAKGGNCTFVVHYINVPNPQFLMKWH